MLELTASAMIYQVTFNPSGNDRLTDDIGVWNTIKQYELV